MAEANLGEVLVTEGDGFIRASALGSPRRARSSVCESERWRGVGNIYVYIYIYIISMVRRGAECSILLWRGEF
jgi:hypothetical protein